MTTKITAIIITITKHTTATGFQLSPAYPNHSTPSPLWRCPHDPSLSPKSFTIVILIACQPSNPD